MEQHMNGAARTPAISIDGMPPQFLKKKELFEFTRADRTLTPLAALCGFLFWEWLAKPGASLGVFAFTVALAASALCYFRMRGIRQSGKSLAALGLVAALALHFLIFDDSPVRLLVLPFLSAAYLYWVAVSAGARIKDRVSEYIVFDLVNQTFIAPMASLPIFFKSAAAAFVGKKRGKSVGLGLLGLLLCLPLALAVASLLRGADYSFMRLWDNMLEAADMDRVRTYVLEFFLGIPVAAYLFGSLFCAAGKRGRGSASEEGVARGLARAKIFPAALAYAPLALLNALYLLFFVALGGYLFSAMSGSLPQDLTYAEYARRGFFELCQVATINLCLTAGAYLLLKREAKPPLPLRVLVGSMSAFTVLLVVTALSKMLLYISSYGLTRLRIYTTFFMVWLLLLFLLILLWHVRPFALAGPVTLLAVLCALVLAFGNSDGLIAKYNLEQYEAGRLADVDYVTLARLSDGAAPYVRAAYDRQSDGLAKANLRAVMMMLGRHVYDSEWRFEYRDGVIADTRAPWGTRDSGAGGGPAPEGAGVQKNASQFQRWNLQSFWADGLRGGM
ncbi:MAG: DUF4173 domain-containing protein [Clostridiales Family XIII bacterium]|jgi:hypothetical protein|nr:DUF4173 domain-containing protein [Clostridiales Family XIII bacterium]